jgi:hypothetical protein
MTTVNVLDYASLFLWIATPDDIEHERQRLEAAYCMKIEVFEVQITTRSGARVTRVTWKEAA